MLDYHSLWQSLSELYDPREAQAIVRMVLDEKYGLSLTDIVSGGVESLPASQKEELRAVMLRLQKGEPVQYVLGYAWFCGRMFHVAPGVLIPRPETEQLVKSIIQASKFKVQSSKFKVLDVGTGSGCIAITLALEMPDVRVMALDISYTALDIARLNAETLKADVSFIKGDALNLGKTFNNGERFDIIVSNPPYITKHERGQMAKNVLDYEPSTALFVPDDDPLLFYRAIGKYAIDSLSADGKLFFEINPLFAMELETMLFALGFREVSIIDDDFGKHRFAVANK